MRFVILYCLFVLLSLIFVVLNKTIINIDASGIINGNTTEESLEHRFDCRESLNNLPVQFHLNPSEWKLWMDQILLCLFEKYWGNYGKKPPTSVPDIKHFAKDEQFLNVFKSATDFNPPYKPVSLSEVMDEFLNLLQHGLTMDHQGTTAMVSSGNIDIGIFGHLIDLVTNKFGGVSLGGAVNQLGTNSIKWFCRMLDFPDECYGTYTSGASMANLHGLVVARDQKLSFNGIYDMSKGKFYTSQSSHYTVKKLVKVLGVPENSIRVIPTTDKFGGYKMNTTILRERIEYDISNGDIPCAVIATAGTTDVGAIDPLVEIAEICEEFNVHFHVDAAIGGFFYLTKNGREELKGINLADTISTDLHKSMFFGHGIGLLLAKNYTKLLQSFGVTTKKVDLYLPEGGVNLDEMFTMVNDMDVSMELTRPNRGIRVWFALKVLGIKKFQKCLERMQEIASKVTNYIKKFLKNELVIESFDPIQTIPIVLFRCKGENDPEKTNELMTEINRVGKCLVSLGEIGGYHCARMMFLNPKTSWNYIRNCMEDLKEISKRVC